MKPDQASLDRAAYVASLAPGSRVHVSGICGTGMVAAAQLLKQLGFKVTGSDKAFYPPMGDVARQVADKLYEGYDAANLQDRPDLVIIGNNLRRDNPESAHVLENKIPFASMPEVFSALLIGTREECPTSVVVAGTHGKTTTSAAVAVMLEHLGRRPGYFVGGVLADLPTSVRAVDKSVPKEQRAVVLEGDEYDSAFFAKWSKFHSYRPDIAIVTSLEFDHADIFNSLADIEAEFEELIRKLPKDGLLLLCDTEARLKALNPAWKKLTEAEVCLYGRDASSPYRLVERVPSGDGQKLTFSLRGSEMTFTSPLTGEHNALNLLAAAAVGTQMGFSPSELASALPHFTGTKRRQQLVGHYFNVRVFEDFAHHPTAIFATLSGLKDAFPDSRLLAVYEPRSNTARRQFFQTEYPKSFQPADIIVILEVADAGGYSNTAHKVEALDVGRVISDIRRSGRDAYGCSSVEQLETLVQSLVIPTDIVCIMSNGDFGGMIPRFVAELKERGEARGIKAGM